MRVFHATDYGDKKKLCDLNTQSSTLENTFCMPNCDLVGGLHWFINKNKPVVDRDAVFSQVDLSTLHSKEVNRGDGVDSRTNCGVQVM